MAEMLVCRDGEMAEGGVRIVRAGKFEIAAGGKHWPSTGAPTLGAVAVSAAGRAGAGAGAAMQPTSNHDAPSTTTRLQ